MSSNHQLHRRAQSHSLFMGIIIAVFAVATIVSSCRNDGELSSSEQKEMLYYNNAINNAQDSGLYEKMRKLCKEFYEVSKKGHSDLFRAHAVSDYGQESLLFGNPDEGMKLLDEALQIASKTSDDTLMMEIYNGLGLYHQVKDRNYYAASEYYLKSLEYARRCDKRNLLAVLCNLGASYGGANDTTGLKYAREAYEIAKETGTPNDMMYASMRMADQMKMRGNKEETLKWQQIWMENLPEARRMVFENVIKAENSFLQNNFTEALRYIDIAIVVADTTKNLQTVEKTNIIIEKAKILYELGRYEESIKWLDKDSVMASMANNKIRRESRLLYAMNYEKLGNHVKALENQKKYIEYIEEETKVDRINILKAKEVELVEGITADGCKGSKHLATTAGTSRHHSPRRWRPSLSRYHQTRGNRWAFLEDRPRCIPPCRPRRCGRDSCRYHVRWHHAEKLPMLDSVLHQRKISAVQL